MVLLSVQRRRCVASLVSSGAIENVFARTPCAGRPLRLTRVVRQGGSARHLCRSPSPCGLRDEGRGSAGGGFIPPGGPGARLGAAIDSAPAGVVFFFPLYAFDQRRSHVASRGLSDCAASACRPSVSIANPPSRFPPVANAECGACDGRRAMRVVLATSAVCDMRPIRAFFLAHLHCPIRSTGPHPAPAAGGRAWVSCGARTTARARPSARARG